VRRVKADLVMIAGSTGGWTSDETPRYAHDISSSLKIGRLTYVAG
jgi:hypothetical protein